MQLPRRNSLVEQVTDLLRCDLRSGRWPDQLPGEHQLSDQLQVSRSTLRAALQVLHKEGLLLGGRGRRRTVSRSTGSGPPVGSATIGAIMPVPLHRLPTRTIIILDELRRHLQQAGFELKLHIVTQTGRLAGRRRLEQLVGQTRAACWILCSCSAELQRWFAEGRGPALVHGSCHEDIDLPFIRCDTTAACRHAVSRLRAKGHRHLGLLLPVSQFAGTLEIEMAFRQSTEDLPPAQRPVRFHAGDAPAVERAILGLMRPVQRPTAIVTMMPGDALATCSLLLSRGYRIPQDVSVVSIFDDPSLSFLIPPLSRYGYDEYHFARRMTRLTIKLARQAGRPSSVSTLPHFVAGATIGPAA
jgi:LacI family transcriptional regulator